MLNFAINWIKTDESIVSDIKLDSNYQCSYTYFPKNLLICHSSTCFMMMAQMQEYIQKRYIQCKSAGLSKKIKFNKKCE